MTPNITKNVRECSQDLRRSIELAEKISTPISKFNVTNFNIFVNENYFKSSQISIAQHSFIFPNTLASEDLHILFAYQDDN